MPYSRKRYGSKRRSYTRKGSRSSTRRKTYRGPRRGKYSKVSRKRSAWTSGTVVSPYRRFVYNDEDFVFTLTNLMPYTWHIFAGNSVFDPDYTGAGVQPYGYDQFCPGFYQNYQVTSSKITIYPYLSLINVVMPQRLKVVIVPYYDTAIPYTEYTDIIRMPGAKSRILSWYANDNRTVKISAFAKTSSVLGKSQAHDASAVSLYSTNPLLRWYWWVFCFSGDSVNSGDNINIRFDTKISYYTVLSQKVELNNS